MRALLFGAAAALCLAAACGDDDSGTRKPDAGAPSSGGASSGGGSSGTGAAPSSSGGAGTGGAGSGGVASGTGGGGNVDAASGAGGTGEAGGSGGVSAAGGSAGGTGGGPPLPYCNGHSGDLTTDGLNCGKCGNTCQPSGIASGLNAPDSIVADGNHVYWAENVASGRIFQVPLGSANTTNPPSIASGQKNPRSLATDGANLYWLTDDGVMKRPVAGGAAVSVAAEPATYRPGDLALDGTSIYWTTHSDTDASHHPAVKKMPLGGGTAIEVTTLAVTGSFASIAVDATYVYFVHNEHVGSITSQRRDAHLYKVPRGGGEPVEIHEISSYTNILDLAADAKYLYFTTFERLPGAPTFNFTSGTLIRMPLGGGPAETLGSHTTTPVALAVNDQGAFWALSAISPTGGAIGGGIWSEPKSLAERMRLAWNSQPTSLNVTSTHLYITDWLDNGSNNGKVTRFGLCVNSTCQ